MESGGGEQLWRKVVDGLPLTLGLYVDDGAIIGPRALVLAELNALGQQIIFKPPQIMEKFLGEGGERALSRRHK
mgnify:CR=1 FL=1